MDIKLRGEDKISISADHKESNFIRVSAFGYDALAVDLHMSFQYIEVRKKLCQVRVFSFKKKSDKKDCDFGWWKDAEVILAINEKTI